MFSTQAAAAHGLDSSPRVELNKLPCRYGCYYDCTATGTGQDRQPAAVAITRLRRGSRAPKNTLACSRTEWTRAQSPTSIRKTPSLFGTALQTLLLSKDTFTLILTYLVGANEKTNALAGLPELAVLWRPSTC